MDSNLQQADKSKEVLLLYPTVVLVAIFSLSTACVEHSRRSNQRVSNKSDSVELVERGEMLSCLSNDDISTLFDLDKFLITASKHIQEGNPKEEIPAFSHKSQECNLTDAQKLSLRIIDRVQTPFFIAEANVARLTDTHFREQENSPLHRNTETLARTWSIIKSNVLIYNKLNMDDGLVDTLKVAAEFLKKIEVYDGISYMKFLRYTSSYLKIIDEIDSKDFFQKHDTDIFLKELLTKIDIDFFTAVNSEKVMIANMLVLKTPSYKKNAFKEGTKTIEYLNNIISKSTHSKNAKITVDEMKQDVQLLRYPKESDILFTRYDPEIDFRTVRTYVVPSLQFHYHIVRESIGDLIVCERQYACLTSRQRAENGEENTENGVKTEEVSDENATIESEVRK